MGYMGLGDIFVLVFFGPVAVAGTYYVQAISVTPEVIVAGLAPGLISTATTPAGQAIFSKGSQEHSG